VENPATALANKQGATDGKEKEIQGRDVCASPDMREVVMSHRWDCPSRWEAEREGARAQEWGRSRSSNPYEDYYRRDEGCPESADAWRDGYRRAEIREDERREEEAAQHRAAVRRAEVEAEESYYMEQQYEPYPQEQFPEPPDEEPAQ
jgi:hypothetical protein